ncbi:hypothetical protein GIB67_028587 [Kingdonia uniflora]|uniref:Uncharacterized protein n=1 Tax=Kingdonia uniflora TaxID=39325 RepID=A0A7J7KZD0_9MAGN|nr:hypothetical protein GIB67_028587 [Kingdonia uniflora]
MAASGPAYADVMEIPACAVGTSSSLVRRPKIKKTVPPSEQIAPVQIPPVGTEGVDADENMAPSLKKQKEEFVVEQEALDLATCDPIRLDTQIRSSISQLSVAWKSAAEVLKLAAANRGELVRQHNTEKVTLREQFEQEMVLQREQFEKEKALHKDKFEKEAAATKQEAEDEAKKVADIAVASRNKLIQVFYFWGLSREDVDLALAGKYGEIIFPGDDASPVAEQTPAPPVADDPTKEEVVHLRGEMIEMEKALSRARDFVNRTQQVEDKEQDKLAALSASNKKLSTKLQPYSLAVERTILLNSKLESEMLELQSRLNIVTVELSCKDAEILTANNESELWKESLKKKNLKTMAAKQQRKNNRAQTHEEACSKKNRELNEAINKCNSRIANLDRDKQALVLECMQGNEFFEELHMKYKESQRMMDAAEAEINYSRELARLSYIDNLMLRVMELVNVPSVVDVAIPFPVLLSSGPGESSNVLCPKNE